MSLTEQKRHTEPGRAEYLTGRDLGVVVCRGLAIVLLFVGIGSAIDVLKYQLSFDIWQEEFSVSSALLLLAIALFFAFGIYLAFAMLLWFRAGAIASRMLGEAEDRVLFAGTSASTAVRVVVICVGVWFGITASIRIGFDVVQFGVGYMMYNDPGGFMAYVQDFESPEGGGSYLRYMLQPGAYLVASLLCIFGAGAFVRLLKRTKSLGLDQSDNS